MTPPVHDTGGGFRSARHAASPRTRRLAADRGVDLHGLTGTGPRGRVTGADVLRASGSGAPHAHSPRVRRLARERGVDLDALAGTGPRGRVLPGDVLRVAPEGAPPRAPEAERAASDGPAEASRGTVAHDWVSLELDTGGGAAADLVADVVAATAASVRLVAGAGRGGAQQPTPGVDVVLHRHGTGEPVVQVVSDAHDMAPAGVRAAAATAEPRGDRPEAPDQRATGATRVAVHDLTGTAVLGGGLAPRPDEVLSVTVTGPHHRAVVVDADGGPGVAVRSIARLTVTWVADRPGAVDGARVAALLGPRLGRTPTPRSHP